MQRALALILALAASRAEAGQCDRVSRETAEKAVKLLAPGTTVLLFCEPCGDTKGEIVTVKAATIEAAADPDAKGAKTTAAPSDVRAPSIVKIDGRAIDLAYAYVRDAAPDRANRYANVALATGCAAGGVSLVLTYPPEGGERSDLDIFDGSSKSAKP